MTLITRQRELEWHRHVAGAPLFMSLGDVQSQLDEATVRYQGASGMAAFAPSATIESPDPKHFAALSIGIYIGETRLTRALLSECRITRGRDRDNTEALTPAELLDSDQITVAVQFSGTSRVEPEAHNLTTRAGMGRYFVSSFKHTTSYSSFSDVLFVSTPISRIPGLAEGLCAQPARLFPGNAVDLATFTYLSQFLFRRLVGPRKSLESETEAENSVIGVLRSALSPLLQVGDTSSSMPMRRRIDQEIELDHRDPDFTVNSLAALVGLSRRQLYRVAGDGVAGRLRQARCKTARELIQAEPGLELNLVARLSGFSVANRLRDQFVRTFSILPSTYREDVRKQAAKRNSGATTQAR